jgi:hypothetical protein
MHVVRDAGFSGNGIFQNRNQFSKFFGFSKTVFDFSRPDLAVTVFFKIGISFRNFTPDCRPFSPVTDFNRNFPNSSFGIFSKNSSPRPTLYYDPISHTSVHLKCSADGKLCLGKTYYIEKSWQIAI